ncbi:peptidoglycan DD-metalloendopeptidase family protein [Conexibacter sp. W3-3-2]|uniref:M23 family metallopeptidase n=1 Tax=Conexibacter sp. W3-3-2 TaxID=2675227 RepID=UPI0012B89C24|nr:M23 family metallopeptidase [Conexibacter sp. W3-3-2]MTD47065.1 peptidoglycan DD-metalloendopeptidase family protein [Conexibacter sp. W3-3-2]
MLSAAFLAGPAVAVAASGSGGSFASETPQVTGIACVTACTGLDSAGPGSVVRLSGEALDRVSAVAFLGADGIADDRMAAPTATGPGSVTVTVPAGAASGPVAVANDDGNASGPSRARLAVVSPATAVSSGGVEARVEARRVFYAGRRKARLSYFVRSAGPASARAELVKARTGTVVRSYPAVTVPGRTVQSLEWDGTVGGKVPSDGTYLWRLRLRPAGTTATMAQSGETVVEQPFEFVRDRFPILGRYRFGTGAGEFGAARGGRSHQGRDVFAACGTPLGAVRGGRVKFAGVQARAGNYLVIDPDGTGQDHVYMHLRRKVTFRKGDRVFTGQRIGEVGDTGVADGCHLHFELWTAPGWYSGGRPIDPSSALRRWERRS